MYSAVLFIGITNATAVQPVVYVERFVSYRERAAGMYSAVPFALAQVWITSTLFFHLSCQFPKVESDVSKLFWTGCHRVPVCVCTICDLQLYFLLHGLIPVEPFQVYVVFILHVLHLVILHLLRNDDYCCHTQSQCRCNTCCSILYDVEPFQWIHDPSHGNAPCHFCCSEVLTYCDPAIDQ